MGVGDRGTPDGLGANTTAAAGSTYSGNPLGAAVAMEALNVRRGRAVTRRSLTAARVRPQIVVEEDLAAAAEARGAQLMRHMTNIMSEFPSLVRTRARRWDGACMGAGGWGDRERGRRCGKCAGGVC